MKRILFLVIIVFASAKSFSQFTLYKGNSALEISGYITSFYNYRFYPKGETDKKKNRFALDYAVLKLDGVLNKVWNYQLQINNAALFDPTTSDGFIMQADVAYTGLKDNFSIDFGYNKLPFCRSSLISNTDSPFLQRPDVARGGVFNRRDAGATVTYSLFNKQINLYTGAYTGLGATTLASENDAGGKLEYIGRAEISYPTRFRYREVDLTHVPLPIFSAGFDARYAEKNTVQGVDFPIQTIDGKKTGISGDFNFMWKGISVMAEFVKLKMVPHDTSDILGKPTDYFMAGGVVLSANYFVEQIKSVIAVRYDDFNPNDLIIGDTERTLSFGYNYLFDGMRAAIKIHYFKRLKDKDASVVWTDDQVRIALQLMF